MLLLEAEGFYIGVVNKSGVAAGCGVFLLVIVAVVAVRKCKEMRRR